MTRTNLAAMRNSNFNQATQSQQADIQEWIEEILTDADKHQVRGSGRNQTHNII